MPAGLVLQVRPWPAGVVLLLARVAARLLQLVRVAWLRLVLQGLGGCRPWGGLIAPLVRPRLGVGATQLPVRMAAVAGLLCRLPGHATYQQADRGRCAAALAA